MKRFTFLYSILTIMLSISFTFYFVGCDNQPNEPSTVEQALEKKGGVPADGNGNKLVFSWDEPWSLNPVGCGNGNELYRHDKGWVQIKLFGPENNPNIELDVFHIVVTYTNESGQTFTWHDVGPDHYYLEGEELHLSISGRSTASGNVDRDEINVGHVVINIDTGEVELVAGNNYGPIDDLACDELY